MDLAFDKVMYYIYLNSELDTRNDFYISKMGELTDFSSSIELEINFINEELKALTTDILKKYLKETPELKEYEFVLKNVIKNNSHLLSLECENLLAKISPVLSTGDEIFSALDDADSEYEDILDSKGKKHKLTNGTYARYISSMDPVLRKNASLKLHEYYKKHANTLSSCLFNHIKTSVIEASLRKYDSALASALSIDDLDVKFYNNFIIPKLEKSYSDY